MQEASELANPQEDDFIAAPLEVGFDDDSETDSRAISLNGIVRCEAYTGASTKGVRLYSEPCSCQVFTIFEYSCLLRTQ